MDRSQSAPGEFGPYGNKFLQHVRPRIAGKYVVEQLSKILYRTWPNGATSGAAGDRAYTQEHELWADILDRNRKTRCNDNVRLDGFYIFEWLPRSPGLFYTEDAIASRKSAEHNIYARHEGNVVYDPYGKFSMLDGGFGTIRLQPIVLNDGDNYIVSASSSGICHQGFPLAIPKDLYRRYEDEIIEKGAAYCALTGRMQYFDETLSQLYMGYRGVPLLYLKVEELERMANKPAEGRGLYVTPAVTFVGHFREEQGHFATYVTANLAHKDSLDNGLKWMEDEYVGKMHDGVIVTDFDEQQRHFRQAKFSLAKVMAGNVQNADLAWLTQQGVSIDGNELLRQQQTIIQHADVVNVVNTDGGAYVGRDVSIHGGSFTGRDEHVHDNGVCTRNLDDDKAAGDK